MAVMPRRAAALAKPSSMKRVGLRKRTVRVTRSIAMTGGYRPHRGRTGCARSKDTEHLPDGCRLVRKELQTLLDQHEITSIPTREANSQPGDCYCREEYLAYFYI